MPKKAKRFPKINPTAQLLGAIALFVGTVWAAGDSDVRDWEVSVFQWVYGLPDFLYPFFLFITQFGSIYVLAMLLIAYMVKRHYHIVLRLLMTGTLAYLVAGFAKDIWGRPRPTELLLDVVSRDFIVRGPAFPSGHVALAVALALTIGHYLPRKHQWLVPAWIAGVALSRMYLGVHVPLDLIAGFAIGWGSYALFRHVRLYDVSFGHRPAQKPLNKPSGRIKKSRARPARARPA